MPTSVFAPPASFVKFSYVPEDHCVYGLIDLPLPVVYSSDVAFQFVVSGSTEAETNALYNADVRVGLVNDCADAAFLIEFPPTAVRSKLAPTQILFNWGAGFPGFSSVVSVGECFRVRIKIGDDEWCSNPFKRIGVDDDTCWSSVVSYSNESGGFGFFGCGPVVDPGTGGPIDEEGNCIPMIVDIPNVPTISIPITAEMVEKYGQIPSVQVWLYDSGGNLYNAGIVATFTGGYPPTGIFVDLGGPANGKIRIGQ